MTTSATTMPPPPAPALPLLDVLRGQLTTARALADALLKAPPCTNRNGGETCISRERRRPLTQIERRRGWAARPFYAYDQERLCVSCNAYFHATNTVRALEELVKREALAQVETESRTGT